MTLEIIIAAVLALLIGAALGWLIGTRGAAGLTVERDLHLENFKRSINDLNDISEDRNKVRMQFAALERSEERRVGKEC